MEYISIPLDETHIRRNFKCGKEKLDKYLHNQVTQDIERDVAVCFVIIDKNNNVMGYYTLSNSSIPKEGLPPELKKKYAKSYPYLPATLLGRLAVDKFIAGKGYGQMLLIDALKRSFFASKKSIASLAVIVDPLDEEAISFYKKFGFILLPDSGKMFLTMKTISTLFPAK